MPRKPWEQPVIYNDDRWVEADASAAPASPPAEQSDPEDDRDARDVAELLTRPDDRGEREYECTDTTPINYKNGPHDREFGVDEKDFDDDVPNPPVPYGNGPHDEELGLTDDEEYEDADPDEDFDEDV